MYEEKKDLKNTVEELLDEVEIEVYGKKGEKPPKAKKYKIRIDKEKYVVESGTITGAKILELAGKIPVDNYRLDQKIKGGATKKIEPYEVIDLTEPGIERFMTLPLDQREGSTDEATLKRQFCLPEDDRLFLGSKGYIWETVKEDNWQWVLIHNFPIPNGYNVETATVAVSIPVGYPVAQIDMAYFYPILSRTDGNVIGATEAIQQIQGVAYQRWSRHRTGENPWRPGVDDISTHLSLVEEWLNREFKIR